jgi:hypothetical protein
LKILVLNNTKNDCAFFIREISKKTHVKNLIIKFIFLISLMSLFSLAACAVYTANGSTTISHASDSNEAKPNALALIGKVMVLDFPLNDLTDLPNPPQELARIAYFNASFKQKLTSDGVDIVPVNNKIKSISETQSATYLFDHADVAASLAEGSGADYIIVGVAMKPTYLFVYPRLLLVDVKTKRKAFTAYVQMEGSWLDNTTTSSSANRLADKVSKELKKMSLQAN